MGRKGKERVTFKGEEKKKKKASLGFLKFLLYLNSTDAGMGGRGDSIARQRAYNFESSPEVSGEW